MSHFHDSTIGIVMVGRALEARDSLRPTIQGPGEWISFILFLIFHLVKLYRNENSSFLSSALLFLKLILGELSLIFFVFLLSVSFIFFSNFGTFSSWKICVVPKLRLKRKWNKSLDHKNVWWRGRQADTKNLTSSSKFSGSCVLT